MNIKERRIAMGASQEKLSILLGVSNKTVHFWETGKSKPSAKHLERLKRVFGIKEEHGNK